MENYVMIGALLPYKNFRSDRLEAFLDAPNNTRDGLTVISDGMSGRYIAVGKVLACAPEGEGFDSPIEINTQPWEEDEVRLKILETIGQSAMDHLPAKGCATLVFTHYR
jgi:hypothetical protein